MKQSIEGALTASDGKQFQIRLETGENSSQEAHFLPVSKKLVQINCVFSDNARIFYK